MMCEKYIRKIGFGNKWKRYKGGGIIIEYECCKKNCSGGGGVLKDKFLGIVF